MSFVEMDSRAQRVKLIRELCESEGRYARSLRSFVRISEQCTFPGWSAWEGLALGEAGEKELHGKMALDEGLLEQEADNKGGRAELWCLRETLEQIATLSETLASCLRQSLSETGGDRAAGALDRAADMFFLYEDYAKLFPVAIGVAAMFFANDDFRKEWRSLVATERERVHRSYPTATVPTTVDAYLILPIQRLPRYEMLLTKIIEESESHPSTKSDIDASWLRDELYLCKTALDKVRATATEMDKATEGSSALFSGALCVGPSSSESVDLGVASANVLAARMLQSECAYLKRLRKLEKYLVVPLASLSSGAARTSASGSPSSPGSPSMGSGSPRKKEFDQQRLKLHQEPALVVLCQRITQARRVCQYIVDEIISCGQDVDKTCDLVMWLAGLSRLSRGLVVAFPACASLLCQVVGSRHELDAESILGVMCPSWQQRYIRTLQQFARPVHRRTSYLESFLSHYWPKDENQDCILLEMPINRVHEQQHQVALLLMHPLGGLESRRTDLGEALTVVSSGVQEQEDDLCLRGRALALLLLKQEITRQSDEDEASFLGEHGATSIPLRCGPLYVKKKPMFTWLFADRILLLPLSPSGEGFGQYKASRRPGRLVCHLLGSASSVFSESQSSLVSLSPGPSFRVPQQGDPMHWSIPVPRPNQSLYDIWAREISVAFHSERKVSSTSEKQGSPMRVRGSGAH